METASVGEMAMNATRPRRLQIRQNTLSSVTESAFGVAVQRLQTKRLLPWGEITSVLQQGGMDGHYALAPTKARNRHHILEV